MGMLRKHKMDIINIDDLDANNSTDGWITAMTKKGILGKTHHVLSKYIEDRMKKSDYR